MGWLRWAVLQLWAGDLAGFAEGGNGPKWAGARSPVSVRRCMRQGGVPCRPRARASAKIEMRRRLRGLGGKVRPTLTIEVECQRQFSCLGFEPECGRMSAVQTLGAVLAPFRNAGYIDERRELANFIKANSIRNLCMISGEPGHAQRDLLPRSDGGTGLTISEAPISSSLAGHSGQ